MTLRTLKTAAIEFGNNPDRSWRVESNAGDSATWSTNDAAESSLSISEDGVAAANHVRIQGDLRVANTLSLPLNVDYDAASPNCFVPKSIVDNTPRRPAFTRSLTHARVEDANPYSTRKTGDIMTRTNGKWGPVTLYRNDPPTQLVFHGTFLRADVYDSPRFRTARFGPAFSGSPASDDAATAVVRNAFPAPASTSVDTVRVSLANLQIPPTAGSTCKIRVTLRILDSAVDTGRYEGEVFREFDVTEPDELVQTGGAHADGKWNWSKSRDLIKSVDVAADGAIRVQIRVVLTEIEDLADPVVYGTVYLKTTPAAFIQDAFTGTANPAFATTSGWTLNVSHDIVQTAGRNMGVVCRVYNTAVSRTPSQVYAETGNGATGLVASGAYPITGSDGVVGQGPLSFPKLKNGWYWAYVVAKGSSGVYSVTHSYSREIIKPLPTLVLSTTTSAPTTTPVTVYAQFSEPVTGFRISDVACTNGTVSDLTGSDGDSSYAFTVTPTTAYTATFMTVNAGTFADLAGNLNTATAALSFTYIPYNPGADPTLMAWYDPSDASTLSYLDDGAGAPQIGESVGMMRNKKQDAYHLTQATLSSRPTWATNEGAIAGSWLEFKAYPNRRTLALASSTDFFNTGSRTIAYVAKQRYTTSAHPAPYWSNGASLAGLMFCTTSAGTPRFSFHILNGGFIRASAANASSDGAVDVGTRADLFDDKAHVFQMRYLQGSSPLTWDASFDAVRSGAPAEASFALPSTKGFQLGGDSSNIYRAFDGWIGEFLVFDTYKSIAQQEEIRAYLKAKWIKAPPTLTLWTMTNAPTTSPVTVYAQFSEPVTGFEISDVTCANGTPSDMTGSDGDSSYTFTVTPATANTATAVTVNAGAFADLAGNLNTALATLSFMYITYNPGADPTLMAWYDPSDASTLSSLDDGTGAPQIGDPVGVMRNKAQNAYHLTQATLSSRPTRATNAGAIAGSWLEFNAYPNRRTLAIPSTTEFFHPVQQSRTVAFVAKQRYTTSSHPAPYPTFGSVKPGLMFCAENGYTPWISYFKADGGVVEALWRRGMLSQTLSTRADFFDDNAHVFQMRYSDTVSVGSDGTETPLLSGDACFDTVRTDIFTSTTDWRPTGFQIGGDSSDITRAFDGWIGEFLVFSEYKTPAQQDEIRAYLRARWNTK